MHPGPNTPGRHPWGDAATPYEEMGGEADVRALVDRFYDLIDEESPLLRSMLPADMTGSRQKLYEYFSGWLGGPPLYTEKRGHPQLRLRHLPFAIGDIEAQEWMRCMGRALDETSTPQPLRAFLVDKLTPLALHMRNQA